MGIVRFLIFASLVAGTLGFFWPKFGQEEIRPWDLADQMEEEARLEKICQEGNHLNCVADGVFVSGAFASMGLDPCGRPCPKP